MKKIFIVYALLIVAVLGIAFFKFRDFSFLGGKKEVVVNNQVFKVDIADNDKERTIGLSGKKSIAENEGMLFVFEKKDIYPFWMKKMQFPIDIIYLDDSKVVAVKENFQPPANPESLDVEVYQPTSPANHVLEINAGLAKKYNIKTGDTITLPK